MSVPFMKRRRVSLIEIWIWAILFVILLAFGWPYLISAKDTLAVLGGILTMIGMGSWLWSIFRRLVQQFERSDV